MNHKNYKFDEFLNNIEAFGNLDKLPPFSIENLLSLSISSEF